MFCTELHPHENSRELSATNWARLMREGRELLQNFLDIEVPVIAAVNGPVHASTRSCRCWRISCWRRETAEFADRVHFVYGVVPGDGVHVVWPMLLGMNRARHFLMTGSAISAAEAHALGVVAEVLPARRVAGTRMGTCGEP